MPEFNQEEFSFLANADLLIKKRLIQKKIFTLLELTQNQLHKINSPALNKQVPSGKISRGENYKGLPYLILDYPAIFNHENIMAYRTMFLWGNFFSTTVHLQGNYLRSNREKIGSILAATNPKDVYLSTGETPWHYHYDSNNYRPLTAALISESLQRDFIKISKKIALEDHSILSNLAIEFYTPFLKQLKMTS